MGFKRYATAHWEGDLKTGQGRMSTPQSGLFDGTRYSFNTRFGEEKGTNPEELLAAAHAGCFSMALGFILQNAGFIATRIDTRAEVLMETVAGAARGGRAPDRHRHGAGHRRRRLRRHRRQRQGQLRDLAGAVGADHDERHACLRRPSPPCSCTARAAAAGSGRCGRGCSPPTAIAVLAPDLRPGRRWPRRDLAR